jgi:hypothetical protein
MTITLPPQHELFCIPCVGGNEHVAHLFEYLSHFYSAVKVRIHSLEQLDSLQCTLIR